jgi:hypothetical protein
LHNLGLSPRRPVAPADLVRRLGAVQAQDYAPALWSVGARTGLAAPDVAQAVEKGELVRTHALRPTWHLLPAEDVVWVQELTSARVHALNAHYYRRMGLDAAALERSRRIVGDALGDAGELTRAELSAALTLAGVDVSDLRLPLIVMNAELTATIGSGHTRGKQQTYILLESSGREQRRLDPDAALAELTWRYFSSHGPASARDFAWWCSLPRADVLRGLESVGDRLRRDELDGVPVWGPSDDDAPSDGGAHLLQTYDEYIVGYTQTKYVLDISGAARARPEGVVVRNPLLLVGGQVAGQWRRTIGRRAVTIEVTTHRKLTRSERSAVAEEAQRHGAFLGVEAQLTLT